MLYIESIILIIIDIDIDVNILNILNIDKWYVNI